MLLQRGAAGLIIFYLYRELQRPLWAKWYHTVITNTVDRFENFSGIRG